MSKKGIAVLILCGCVTVLVEGQTLLRNGGFETPNSPADTRQAGTPDGWTWAGTSGWIIRGTVSYLGYLWPTNAPDGAQFVEIGNSESWVLSQTVTITNAGVYLLSWFDNTPTPPSTSLYSVAVLNAATQAVTSGSFDAMHAGQWQQRQLLFGLPPGQFTVRFRAEGNGNSHSTLIDNVSLALQQLPGKVVSGIMVNQLWTSTNSPYRVVGDLRVARLTIQPGVTVLVSGDYGIEVDGLLKAVGTATDPIAFTSAGGQWQGLFFNQALPGCELAHCIVENSANSGVRITTCSPLIADCTVRSNSVSVSDANTGSLSLEAAGGGIKTDSALTLENCTINNNSVITVTSGDQATSTSKGGGVYTTAPLTLLNCTISSNSVLAISDTSSTGSDSSGGGVWAGADLVVKNCLIRGNGAEANSAASGVDSAFSVARGAGVFAAGPCLLKNTIIQANSAKGEVSEIFSGGLFQVEAGGVFLTGDAATIENCTVAFNDPDGMVVSTNVTATGLNSIFWANATNQIAGPLNLTYSDVQGGYAGLRNISANPVFLSSDDLMIVSGSPCANAGSTNVVYQDLLFPPSLPGSRNDMGAHGGPGAAPRLRARGGPPAEVILMGGVPGYTYLIQGSTNMVNWLTLQGSQIDHLGDSAYFVEPSSNRPPFKAYRLTLGP